MAGDEHRAARRHIVGNADGLARVAGVVADHQRELSTQNAARRIDVGHGLFRTAAELFAERGLIAGHRAGGPDGVVALRARGGKTGQGGREHQCGEPFHDRNAFEWLLSRQREHRPAYPFRLGGQTSRPMLSQLGSTSRRRQLALHIGGLHGFVAEQFGARALERDPAIDQDIGTVGDL